MKNLLSFLLLGILLTGCFKDKSEIAIKNCADTVWSKDQVKAYQSFFYIANIYTFNSSPKGIFEETLLDLKRAGFSYKEAQEWAYGLKTTEISDGNKEVINYFIEIKNNLNKFMDGHFKLPLSDRLQLQEYEEIFIKCEQVRKKASKTFDAKWQKPKIGKVQFR